MALAPQWGGTQIIGMTTGRAGAPRLIRPILPGASERAGITIRVSAYGCALDALVNVV